MAEEIIYTATDLLALEKIYLSCDRMCAADFREDVIEVLKRSNLYNENTQPYVVNQVLCFFLKKRMKSIKDLKKFLLYTPLEEVPLYVNNKIFSPYVKWRLTVGK